MNQTNSVYEVAVSQEMGRGLYAKRTIEKYEVIAIFEVLLLNPHDTRLLESTELKHYTFKVNDLQDCLVLGEGELFNHSDVPNVNYELIEIKGRLMMMFTAIQTIKQGEQLMIDYTADAEVDASSYVNSESLMG